MTEDLIKRITYYLSTGGLFNPELADHLEVRNLLIECRDTLAQRKPLTDEEIWETLGGIDCTRPMLIARAIEATHEIKENT